MSKNVHPMELVFTIAVRSHEQPPPAGEAYKAISGSPCMIFKGDPNRYGEIMFNGTSYLAHRVAYEASVNELVPPGLLVRHKCDNLRCVNPRHLETGTHLDNYLDTQTRQRNPAFGARNGMKLYPERIPRGVRKYGRSITEADAADIKQCLSELDSADRADFISIAAHFSTTPDQVEAIFYGDDFMNVPASGSTINFKPLSRENLTVPFPALKRKDLTESQVADLRWEYFVAPNADRRALKLDLRKRYDISRATLHQILGRKTFPNVAPEIPVLKERGSGVAILSDCEVQAIRATWDRFPDLQSKGLTAALDRIFPVSHQSIQRIIDREQRNSVPDDPSKALTLDELPLKNLHQKGENHPMRKLNETQVREIRRLKGDGQLTNRAIAAQFNVTPELIGMIVNRKIWKEVE